MNELIEGEDFYYNGEGNFVLTAKYHLQRGHCCGYGCRHCPFNYKNVPEPKQSELQKTKLMNSKDDAPEIRIF